MDTLGEVTGRTAAGLVMSMVRIDHKWAKQNGWVVVRGASLVIRCRPTARLRQAGVPSILERLPQRRSHAGE